MKSQKDLFSTIQEGAQKLTLTPSPTAWRKLETSLGRQRQQSGRVLMLKRISIAAAVLAILGGAYWWNLNRHPADMGFQNDPLPQSLEELVNDGGCGSYCLMLEVRNSLPYEYAHPVQKGG